ncbi:MAG: phosphate signaling complex protein PhoU [Pyrinomonadaceae bacterium]
MELRRLLDRDLADLRDRVLLLGGETENAVQRAMQSLIERDSGAAQLVLDGDDRIDQLELSIDRRCIETLALRQPAARDLRFVVAVAKVTPVLERIADHACNIARAAIRLNDEPELSHFPELKEMADLASALLRSALDAFTAGDAAVARGLIAEDDAVDRVYERLVESLLQLMTGDPNTIRRAARLLLVAKHLERIGDYVTNICELTVYMTDAEVLRHSA